MENVEKVKPVNGQGSMGRAGGYRRYDRSSTSPCWGRQTFVGGIVVLTQERKRTHRRVGGCICICPVKIVK